jgi:hypothetical protein
VLRNECHDFVADDLARTFGVFFYRMGGSLFAQETEGHSRMYNRQTLATPVTLEGVG